MGTSPDRLITDPIEILPDGFKLVEIKCPAQAKKITLLELCTDKQQKSSFFLEYVNNKYQPKRT